MERRNRYAIVVVVLGLVSCATARAGNRALEFFNQGAAKYQRGDYAGAIADYTSALKFESGSAVIYYNRGLAKTAKGDFDAAITDYTKAIELKPNDVFSYSSRGVAKQGKGDRDGALVDYNRAIALNRHFPYDLYRRPSLAVEVHLLSCYPL